MHPVGFGRGQRCLQISLNDYALFHTIDKKTEKHFLNKTLHFVANRDKKVQRLVKKPI
jgi:hypothetical protein